MAKVDSSTNDELRSYIEYEYDSTNVLTSETLTNIYGSSQFSKTTNYSYDGSGKLVSKEQHDAGNNWTVYWNYTYDERGNKITEEYTRTGNSPWATVTTFTWNNIIENTESSQESSSDDDSSSNTWLVILLAALILGTAYLAFTRSKVDAVRTLSSLDTDKVVEEVLEEE
jgi:YD repeat-containing protein